MVINDDESCVMLSLLLVSCARLKSKRGINYCRTLGHGMAPLSARWRWQCQPRAIVPVDTARANKGMSKSADCDFPHVLIFLRHPFFIRRTTITIMRRHQNISVVSTVASFLKSLIGCPAGSRPVQPISCLQTMSARSRVGEAANKLCPPTE